MTQHPPVKPLAFSDIQFSSGNEHFFFQSGDKTLEIHRLSGEIKKDVNRPSDVRHVEDIKGILGIIRLVSGPFLILITKTSVVGKLRGHEIHRVTGARMVPYVEKSDLPAEALEDEVEYKRLLQSLLVARAFYLSYSLDLTSSVQSRFTNEPEIRAASLYRKADPLFFWNHYVVRDLIAEEAEGWIIPVIRGFVEILPSNRIASTMFDFALISRQSCKRAGTRYNMRGVDEQGYVANFVETEQIIVVGGQLMSILQIRGSIPLFWSQYANLKYKPTPTLAAVDIPEAGFKEHFKILASRYPKVLLVNLIDHKGSEGRLAEAYRSHAETHLEKHIARYVDFDFHKECKGMQYQNLSKLMDAIEEDLEAYGYLHVNENGDVVRTQQGIARNNCVDCLDRTNVVQSMIARFILERQLKDLNVDISDMAAFDFTFKNTWADNADAVSTLYSGTGALKTDYTRTGKRGFRGILNDGMNSAVRYYLNNFRDGATQDAVNLFLGNYVVDPKATSPFKVAKMEKKLSTAITFTVAMGILMLLASSGQQSS